MPAFDHSRFTQDSVTLLMPYNSSSASSYAVEYRQVLSDSKFGTWMLAPNSQVWERRARVSGLQAGETYQYRIFRTDDDGTSPPSSLLTLSTLEKGV